MSTTSSTARWARKLKYPKVCGFRILALLTLYHKVPKKKKKNGNIVIKKENAGK